MKRPPIWLGLGAGVVGVIAALLGRNWAAALWALAYCFSWWVIKGYRETLDWIIDDLRQQQKSHAKP